METTERLTGTRARKGDESLEDYARHVDRQARRVEQQSAAIARVLELVKDRGLVMPDLGVYGFSSEIYASWDCPDRDSFRALVRAVGSTVDNPWNKRTANGSYKLERSADGIHYEIRATWGTCEQVQVGTEVKTTTEVVEPAKTREVVSEVPIYEWRCPDSVLLSELDAAADETSTPALGGQA